MDNMILKSYLTVFLAFMTVLLITAFRYKLRLYIYVLSVISLLIGVGLLGYIHNVENIAAPIFNRTLESITQNGIEKGSNADGVDVQVKGNVGNGYERIDIKYTHNKYLSITKRLVVKVNGVV